MNSGKISETKSDRKGTHPSLCNRKGLPSDDSSAPEYIAF